MIDVMTGVFGNEEEWEENLQLRLENFVEVDPQDEVSQDSWHYNLCCNTLAADCKCEHPIMWEDTYEIPKEYGEVAYEYHSKCSGCKWFYTASCLSYRSWMVDFMQTGEIPPPIDLCSMFTPDPNLS